MSTPTVLVIDDDLVLQSIFSDILSRYRVVFASDGEEAIYQLAQWKPDVVLVDLMLPDIDGLLLLSQIRRSSNVPIIVCSARQEQVDRVLGLRVGADDFIAKPFDEDELEARVAAVLKRSTRPSVLAAESVIQHLGRLQVSDLLGDSWDGKPFHLTKTEHRLLLLLMQHPDEGVTKQAICQELWQIAGDTALIHVLDVHLRRTRAKLRKLGESAPTIESIHGRGLVLQTST